MSGLPEAPSPISGELKVLRLADVLRHLGVSDSTLNRMIARGEFPQPAKFGSVTRVWFVADVQQFLAGKREQRSAA